MNRHAPPDGATDLFNRELEPPPDYAPPRRDPTIRVDGRPVTREQPPARRGPPPPQARPVQRHPSGLTRNMIWARRLLFFVALAVWLYTDGPQSYWGTGAWVDSLRRYLSGGAVTPAAALNPYAVLVLYLLLTLTLNALWFVFFEWWDYATKSVKSTFKAAMVAAITLIPLTALDVAKGAAGFYEYFAVLDLSNYNDLLAAVSLGEAFLGSVVAQLIVMMAWSKRGIWAPKTGA